MSSMRGQAPCLFWNIPVCRTLTGLSPKKTTEGDAQATQWNLNDCSKQHQPEMYRISRAQDAERVQGPDRRFMPFRPLPCPPCIPAHPRVP